MPWGQMWLIKTWLRTYWWSHTQSIWRYAAQQAPLVVRFAGVIWRISMCSTLLAWVTANRITDIFFVLY